MAEPLDAETGRVARRLIRQATAATLATTGRADSPAAGYAYASLVLVAADHGGAALLLISRLAEHSRNIAADSRVSLLFDATKGLADPLAGARLTLLGTAEPSALPAHKARFLARHPAAAVYAGFGDFSMVRVAPARAHLVAGFGRIHWLDARALAFDPRAAEALAEAEPAIVAHMNDDHAETIALYATALLGREPGPWRLSGIDPEGIDLRLDSGAVARLEFDAPIASAGAARATLVELAERARSAGRAPVGP